MSTSTLLLTAQLPALPQLLALLVLLTLKEDQDPETSLLLGRLLSPPWLSCFKPEDRIFWLTDSFSRSFCLQGPVTRTLVPSDPSEPSRSFVLHGHDNVFLWIQASALAGKILWIDFPSLSSPDPLEDFPWDFSSPWESTPKWDGGTSPLGVLAPLELASSLWSERTDSDKLCSEWWLSPLPPSRSTLFSPVQILDFTLLLTFDACLMIKDVKTRDTPRYTKITESKKLCHKPNLKFSTQEQLEVAAECQCQVYS